MPPAQQPPVTSTLITSQRCEQLFREQAGSYDGRALGIHSCLPSTQHTQQLQADGWSPNQHPWLLDQQAGEQSLRCLLWVDPLLEYFAGHFPGHPILPGVVQLDWSLQLAALHWPATAAASQCIGVQNLKFKLPVHPAELLELVLTQQPGKIAFTFSSPSEVRSQGTLLYRV